MNKVTMIGRLTANPEFKINEKGTNICRFRVAVNDRKTTTFINTVTFEKLAQLCQEFLQKGTMVCVDGRLDISQTEERTYVSIVANEVYFLKDTKKKETTEGQTDNAS